MTDLGLMLIVIFLFYLCKKLNSYEIKNFIILFVVGNRICILRW